MTIHIKPTIFLRDYQKLTPKYLLQQKWSTVFADIDNTLVEWDNLDAPDSLRGWVETLKDADITLILVSNNNESRIKRVAEQLQVPYVYPALKPLPHGFQQAMQYTTDTKDHIVMIGDQLLTDMLGAGLFGIHTALVKPLKSSDAFKTRINRFFERILFICLYGPNFEKQWEEKK